MKVSIITATYNSAQTLGQCMDSVLAQNYSVMEYIVIDGASTDDSLKVIKEKAAGYTHIKWVSEPDKGIYDALNKGIAMASGDIIGFVHADDVLAGPTIIEEIVTTFKSQNCDGVYGNLHYVAATNTKMIVRNWAGKVFHPKLLKDGWMPAHPTLYLKTKVYNTNGVFNTAYNIAADYDFILRIFKQPKLNFVYLPKTIIKMRTGGASNRDIKHILQKMREDLSALRSNKVGGYPTLIKKNLSKIPQFLKKESVRDT